MNRSLFVATSRINGALRRAAGEQLYWASIGALLGTLGGGLLTAVIFGPAEEAADSERAIVAESIDNLRDYLLLCRAEAEHVDPNLYNDSVERFDDIRVRFKSGDFAGAHEYLPEAAALAEEACQQSTVEPGAVDTIPENREPAESDATTPAAPHTRGAPSTIPTTEVAMTSAADTGTRRAGGSTSVEVAPTTAGNTSPEPSQPELDFTPPPSSPPIQPGLDFIRPTGPRSSCTLSGTVDACAAFGYIEACSEYWDGSPTLHESYYEACMDRLDDSFEICEVFWAGANCVESLEAAEMSTSSSGTNQPDASPPTTDPAIGDRTSSAPTDVQDPEQPTESSATVSEPGAPRTTSGDSSTSHSSLDQQPQDTTIPQ